MFVPMSKAPAYLYVVIFVLIALVWGVLWRAKSNEANYANEQAAYLHKLDSVTSVNARLTTEVDTLKALAARHTAKGDSIAKTNVTTIILNDARKATRNATVDSVGAILDAFPD